MLCRNNILYRLTKAVSKIDIFEIRSNKKQQNQISRKFTLHFE